MWVPLCTLIFSFYSTFELLNPSFHAPQILYHLYSLIDLCSLPTVAKTTQALSFTLMIISINSLILIIHYLNFMFILDNSLKLFKFLCIKYKYIWLLAFTFFEYLHKLFRKVTKAIDIHATHLVKFQKFQYLLLIFFIYLGVFI